MHEAVIVEAVRTPVGRAHPTKGIYRDVRADDLSAFAIFELLRRANIPAELIDDVYWGCVRQTEEQGYNIARQALLIAGLPLEIGGVTINRNCGSSLQAINQSAQSIRAECDEILIAGGVEHMHHLPMGEGFDPSPKLLERHSRDVFNMGLTAETLAQKYKISREEQDAFALRSHERATVATDNGEFHRETLCVPGKDEKGEERVFTKDQCVRRDTSLSALSALPPVFLPGGTVTAGNSSPINVGAAAVLIMSEEKAKSLGLKPKVKVRSMAAVGVDPAVMGIGPVTATQKALKRAGLTLADIDVIELNEAFAAQALAVIKLLGADSEKVNVRGGAIAIGHALGSSGARIATTLMNIMTDRRAEFGLATMCIGGGQGIATVFENVS
ncbi:3-ketoacyl-CoA thiolase [Candidatus Peribacteria bacterium RIFCSPHIGHO2_01_FULL_51_9]|nr:MAG: 3-ketoacyl-CoA thiolase [Candidatus Peribacteria bacterium RIFCSPHIGHO2_01_FULL_51_9]